VQSRSEDQATIPCPPPDDCDPESGEYSAVNGRSGRSSQVVPRSFETIEENLKERLADIRCPEHDVPADAKLLVADNGALQVIPVGCCDEVDRLVYAALSETATIAPPPMPELTVRRVAR